MNDRNAVPGPTDRTATAARVCRVLGGPSLVLAIGVAGSILAQESNPTRQGDQISAIPFLPGIVSTRAIEEGGTLAPSGDIFVFARREGTWGSASGPATLYETRLIEGTWTEPERLPFSGEYDDGDPFFAPDGRRLFFTSLRPVNGRIPTGHDIWVIERLFSRWGEPRHTGVNVNSPGREYSPVVTADGSLYFASTRDGGMGQGDLYVARRDDDGYGVPQNLGPVVNTDRGEWNVFVAPDESFLIFEASQRATNRSPSGDLYVSYAGGEGWGAPIPLSSVNTPESELNARLSSDGAHLYFARSVTEADGQRHASIFRIRAESVLPHLADSGRQQRGGGRSFTAQAGAAQR